MCNYKNYIIYSDPVKKVPDPAGQKSLDPDPHH